MLQIYGLSEGVQLGRGALQTVQPRELETAEALLLGHLPHGLAIRPYIAVRHAQDV